MFLYTKISKNSSAKYYKKYEEKLVKYIKIFLKKRKKKQKYDPERYKNLLEDEKQKLDVYRK